MERQKTYTIPPQAMEVIGYEPAELVNIATPEEKTTDNDPEPPFPATENILNIHHTPQE
jgi:hypothetical protein